MNIRLVFSESQQCFHNDDVNEPYVVGGGYAVISMSIDREKSYRFTKMIYDKYPHITLKDVRNEFKKYVK